VWVCTVRCTRTCCSFCVCFVVSNNNRQSCRAILEYVRTGMGLCTYLRIVVLWTCWAHISFIINMPVVWL
jgi:hypothetical protein